MSIERSRSRSTRASVLREHNAPTVLEEVALPDELPPGAALVDVQVTTLCGSDAELWTGAMGWPGMLPIVLGHEIVGEVVETGADCRSARGEPVEPGDRIVWSESVCGRCEACTVLGMPVLCENRGYGMRQRVDRPPHVTGGLADRVFVPAAAQILHVPDGLDPRLAAAAGCALKTVLHAFDRAGGVRPGQSVVIQGAGALGLFAAAVARISGASAVTVIGGPPARLELAERFGADQVLGLELQSADRIDAVQRATRGRGADRVFDFAGAPGVADEGVRMAALGGSYVIVGTTSDAPTDIPLGLVMRRQLTITGSVNGDASHLARALDLLVEHVDAAPWTAVFDEAVPLCDAQEALEALVARRSIKPVIDPRSDRGRYPGPSATTTEENA